MEGFDHVVSWTVKVGSHRSPGKEGGTCINEAALVAAGFDYRPVNDVGEMPSCFSRPICRLAMELNDNATDEERQLLLPFVTRLACADRPEIEHARESYIRARLVEPIDIGFGIKVLQGALAIGRQAEPLPPEIVRARMEAAKANSAAAVPVTRGLLFRRIKAWLAAATLIPAH